MFKRSNFVVDDRYEIPPIGGIQNFVVKIIPAE